VIGWWEVDRYSKVTREPQRLKSTTGSQLIQAQSNISTLVRRVPKEYSAGRRDVMFMILHSAKGYLFENRIASESWELPSVGGGEFAGNGTEKQFSLAYLSMISTYEAYIFLS